MLSKGHERGSPRVDLPVLIWLRRRVALAVPSCTHFAFDYQWQEYSHRFFPGWRVTAEETQDGNWR